LGNLTFRRSVTPSNFSCIRFPQIEHFKTKNYASPPQFICIFTCRVLSVFNLHNFLIVCCDICVPCVCCAYFSVTYCFIFIAIFHNLFNFRSFFQKFTWKTTCVFIYNNVFLSLSSIANVRVTVKTFQFFPQNLQDKLYPTFQTFPCCLNSQTKPNI
jgi:hypothetical protein